jgi:hypothetical protein
MSDIFVDNIKHQSSQGSGTITLGASGEKVDLGTGVSGGTLTNTPAFYAYPSGDQTITSGTFTKITLNTELYDTDNAFDSTTNYRFTVPAGKGGKYFFSSNFIIDSMADGNTVDGRIYINGSAINRTYSRSMVSLTGNAVLAPINYVTNLNAGDYVEYYAKHTRGIDRTLLAGYTYFAGYRLIG